jgi:DNA-entry nuclease
MDALGRCVYTVACVGKDIMPTEERGSIGSVKPSGWQTVKYDIVDGKYLYNRCHLIGFQLTGENANERNLITGTRYCNVDGMLPFENMIADYVKETKNHVLYRVTPIYDGDNLVARGVQMEAWSVEDQGEGVCFHVYVYNSQPGVVIDYATGESWLAEEGQTQPSGDASYILNTGSMKFHDADCSQGESIQEENREVYTGDRESLLNQGYVPAGCCKP